MEGAKQQLPYSWILVESLMDEVAGRLAGVPALPRGADPSAATSMIWSRSQPAAA